MLSFSQDMDMELWTKMNFKKKINKKISFSFEPGARYSLNEIFFTKQFIDASVDYLIHSGASGSWRVELGARLTKMPNQTLLGARSYLALHYSKTIKDLKISWRSRFFSEKNVTENQRKYFRNKFTVQHTFFDFLRPFGDGEYLCGLDDNNLNKIRFSVGNSFKVSKKTTIKVFYRIQNVLEGDEGKKKIFGLYLSQKL